VPSLTTAGLTPYEWKLFAVLAACILIVALFAREP